MKYRERDTLIIFLILFSSILPLVAGLFYHKYVNTKNLTKTNEFHTLIHNKQILNKEIQVVFDDLQQLSIQTQLHENDLTGIRNDTNTLHTLYPAFLKGHSGKYESITLHTPERSQLFQYSSLGGILTNDSIRYLDVLSRIDRSDFQNSYPNNSEYHHERIQSSAPSTASTDTSFHYYILARIASPVIFTPLSSYKQSHIGKLIVLDGKFQTMHTAPSTTNNETNALTLILKETWQKIQNSTQGQIKSKYGLISHTTIYPYNKKIRISHSGSGINTNQYANGTDHAWKLISFIPQKTWLLSFKPLLLELLASLLVIGIITLAVTLVISAAREKRRRAEQALQYSLQELEELVQERTEELSVTRFIAEESERLKTAFLQNISHEIRTPMNGIIGFTNLLKRPELGLKERLWYISLIEKSGERMLATIDDLMTISLLESGQVAPFITTGNLADIMQHIYGLFSSKITDKGLEYNYNNECTPENLLIDTDVDKIQIILGKLVQNAIKFTDKGHIRYGVHACNNTLQFYVEDTGKGISPDQIDTVFETFRQTDITLTKTSEGTGLGLSIAKRYAELLGGRIWVKSKKDQGSTFYFTTPLISPDASHYTPHPIKRRQSSQNIKA